MFHMLIFLQFLLINLFLHTIQLIISAEPWCSVMFLWLFLVQTDSVNWHHTGTHWMDPALRCAKPMRHGAHQHLSARVRKLFKSSWIFFFFSCRFKHLSVLLQRCHVVSLQSHSSDWSSMIKRSEGAKCILALEEHIDACLPMRSLAIQGLSALSAGLGPGRLNVEVVSKCWNCLWKSVLENQELWQVNLLISLYMTWTLDF